MIALLFGSALCEVDADGTVAIPAFLSAAIAADDLLVARHEADDCLVGFDREHLKDLADRNERRRAAEEARGEDARGHHRRMRRTFGTIDHLAHDAARLRIPPAMRSIGHIGALALFLGAGDSFEIWNPDLALKCGDDQIRDLAAYRIHAHGAFGVH